MTGLTIWFGGGSCWGREEVATTDQRLKLQLFWIKMTVLPSLQQSELNRCLWSSPHPKERAFCACDSVLPLRYQAYHADLWFQKQKCSHKHLFGGCSKEKLFCARQMLASDKIPSHFTVTATLAGVPARLERMSSVAGGCTALAAAREAISGCICTLLVEFTIKN